MYLTDGADNGATDSTSKKSGKILQDISTNMNAGMESLSTNALLVFLHVLFCFKNIHFLLAITNLSFLQILACLLAKNLAYIFNKYIFRF